jgi:hypothetical protein
MVGGRGVTTALMTTTKKQQSMEERGQRQRMTTAGERQGVVVEGEEHLFCSGGGFTRRLWRMEVEDGRGCSLFFFF